MKETELGIASNILSERVKCQIPQRTDVIERVERKLEKLRKYALKCNTWTDFRFCLIWHCCIVDIDGSDSSADRVLLRRKLDKICDDLESVVTKLDYATPSLKQDLMSHLLDFKNNITAIFNLYNSNIRLLSRSTRGVSASVAPDSRPIDTAVKSDQDNQKCTSSQSVYSTAEASRPSMQTYMNTCKLIESNWRFPSWNCIDSPCVDSSQREKEQILPGLVDDLIQHTLNDFSQVGDISPEALNFFRSSLEAQAAKIVETVNKRFRKW